MQTNRSNQALKRFSDRRVVVDDEYDGIGIFHLGLFAFGKMN